MKRILYEFLRFYVRLGLYFYFRKIIIRGIENIPSYKPVMFTANHQNAFLDALLIVAFTKKNLYFLARASIFKNTLVGKMLFLINLIPIYRMRDGIFKLSNNEEIFQRCYDLLQNGDSLLIFPEGNHDMRRRLRPLSKGFTRIALGALGNSELDNLNILPVGLNYSDHQQFRSEVSIIFDKPLLVGDYTPGKPILLREAVTERMKKLITHIEGDDYEKIVASLDIAYVDYLNPEQVNDMLKTGKVQGKAKPDFILTKIFYPLAVLNNLVVISLWYLIRKKISDPVFISSIKFAYGIFIVPLIYVFQAVIVSSIAGFLYAIAYFFLSFGLVLFLRK